MQKVILVLGFLLFCFGAGRVTHAQTVKVIDAQSKVGVEGATLIWKDQLLFSDERGEIECAQISAQDSITVKHFAYKSLKTSFQQIVEDGYLISLSINPLSLNEVVISVNKWEQRKEDIPNQILSISKRDIDFLDPQTTADILSASGKVFVQKSQQGGGSPMIRGFSANRILLMVDGVRMNNAIFRGGNLQNAILLDAHAIKQSEVILGPGTVIYGSDALGGVMDFHTLSPKITKGDKGIWEGNATVRYASANTEKTGHLDLSFAKGKWAWLGSVSFSDYDDLRMGSRGNASYQRNAYVSRINGQDSVITNDDPNLQIYSGFSQLNLLQKIRFQPQANLNLQYNFHYSRSSDIPRYDRLIEFRDELPRNAEWYYGPQLWSMHQLEGSYLSGNKLFDRVKWNLAFQQYEESRNDRRFDSTILRERTEQVDAFSMSVDFEKEWSEKSGLYYGAEAVWNKVGSTGQSRDILIGSTEEVASRYPDGSSWASVAAYAQFKQQLSSKWTMQSGIRLNHSHLQAELDTRFFPFPFSEIEQNNTAVNGSLGWVYRPRESWQWNLSLSSGFRAPNIDDVGKIFDSEPGIVVVPNPDLKPEYVYNAEIGMRKKWGETFQLEWAAFHSWLDNAMVREDFQFDGQSTILYDGEISQVQALVNTDEARIYGFQIAGNAVLSRDWQVSSTYTFQRGETKDGEAVRHVSPSFGTTRLIFSRKKWRADAYAIYHSSIPFSRLAPSERNKPFIYATDGDGNPYSPEWYTLNLKGSYRLYDRMVLSVGLENILDERYRPYASGIAGPGRNLIISLRSSF